MQSGFAVIRGCDKQGSYSMWDHIKLMVMNKDLREVEISRSVIIGILIVTELAYDLLLLDQ